MSRQTEARSTCLGRVVSAENTVLPWSRLTNRSTARQFEPARFADPALLALVQRVKVQRNAELSARYPQAAGNIVTVRLRDGRTLSERVDYPRGHAQNPLSDAEVEAKFQALAGTRLGRERADAVLRWVWRLDEARDWDGLMSLMKLSN